MFECDLSPHIVRISPIRAYFPPIENPDGRHYEYVTYMPGAPAWEDVTFDFLAHKDSLKNIEEWVKAAYRGEDARKTITVTVRNQAQEDVRTYDLIDCLPIHYTKVDVGASGSGKSTIMKMTLTCKVNRIECK